MAIGAILVFDGVTQAQYDAASGPDGVNSPGPANPGGAWPAGMVAHFAGPTPTGGWCVIDIWENHEAMDTFVSGTLGPVLAKVGMPEPTVTPFEVYNSSK